MCQYANVPITIRHIFVKYCAANWHIGILAHWHIIVHLAATAVVDTATQIVFFLYRFSATRAGGTWAQ